MSLLSIPKDIIKDCIIPYLTYKERTKLYCTCKYFWNMKTDEYIFGRWLDSMYDVIHMINKQETGFLIYEYKNDEWVHWGLINSLDGDFKYYHNNRESIERKLEEYWNQFGAVKRIK